MGKGRRAAALLLTVAVAATTVLGGCGNSSGSDGTESAREGSSGTTTSTGSVGEDLESLTNLSTFGLDQVVQLDDYCGNALDLEVEYLTSFDVDKLLAGFRETAGLDMNGATRYSGWENSLIGGHSVGHYMSAMAQAYANAGVSDDDRETIYSMLTELIDGLVECQENSQGEEGFIFAATIIDSENVEKQFDNVEQGLTNISTQAWVPWYTMHKILAGIIDVYEQTGYEPALTLATGLGDWVYNRVSQWSDATRNTVLGIEYGGMNDALYELYYITGEEKYAIAAHIFDEDTLFEKVLAGGENVLNDLHANTTIPKFLGALKRYVYLDGKEIDGETVDASAYLEYAQAFFEMVLEHHTYITGGNSEWEHFGQDDVLDDERTNCNDETCNVYNMLKLSRLLYQMTGDVKYMDYYENAFYNSILSSQNSETGMTTYFQPMATGYFKVYSTEFTNFWCCTGSGMENFTKLNDSIYFYSDNTVVVNMYFSSTLTWEDQNLELSAKADNFTNDGQATYVVNAISGDTVDVDLRFRVPDWAAGDMV
ncbi:MAG: glycoside hydrolase family 127 protein, partial [Clostridiales bacterium]|nr:glycoside hydrolase family 127 protein [Clostridiales bacterium]